MCAVSSLMLATFYLVDGCARLRTDRLHRRERKNSWSARLQAWLARVRDITQSPCCLFSAALHPCYPRRPEICMARYQAKASTPAPLCPGHLQTHDPATCAPIYAAACRRHRAADSCGIACTSLCRVTCFLKGKPRLLTITGAGAARGVLGAGGQGHLASAVLWALPTTAS